MTNVPAIKEGQAQLPALTIGDLTARAKLVVESGLAPRDMTPQQLAVIMLKGQELGLRPLEAMESLYVVQGKVGEMTHQLVNMLREAGHDYHIDETTMDLCTVTIYRSDGRTYTHTVTFKECDEARWNQYWDIKGSSWKVKPTWQGGGQRTMLAYRTISQAIKLFCPEVLHQQAGRQHAKVQVSTPADSAAIWYSYTRQLIESEGVENVIGLIRSMAEDTVDSPDMIDGDYDEMVDPGEQEPDPPPQQPPTRPYPPEIVRQAIQSRASKGSPEIAPDGLRGATVGAVEGLFHASPKESRTHMRHQLGGYLLGKNSSETWTHGECQALLQWAQSQQDDGTMLPSEMACKEAAAIIRSLDEKGQQELPL